MKIFPIQQHQTADPFFRQVLFTLLLLQLLVNPVSAQNPIDTLSQQEAISFRLPVVPVILHTYLTTGLNSHYRLKQDGKTYERGTVEDLAKAKLILNTPIYNGRFYALSMAANYGYFHSNFHVDNQFSEEHFIPMSGTRHTWRLAANGVLNIRLLNKLVVSNLNFSIDGSEYGVEKYSGRVLALMQMKRTETTSWGIGILGLINSTFPVPLFPFVIWRHQFNPRWTIDLNMPQAGLRYSFYEKQHLSLGVQVDYDHFYLHPKKESQPKSLVYSEVFLKPGLTYECSLGKQLKFSLSGGGSWLISGRIYKKKRYKDYIRVRQPFGSYLDLRVSYQLPGLLWF